MTLLARYRQAIAQARTVLRPVIAFEIWSTLILLLVLTPGVGWLINRLVVSSGQHAVSDHDLLSFLVSVRGILFLVLGGGFILAFMLAEQVGLLIIMSSAARGRRILVSVALWEHVARLPALLRLGLLQATGYLLAAVPFLLGAWLTQRWLLSKWDFYFYLNVRPAPWWIAVAIVGGLALAYGGLAAWLYVRWLFALRTVLFEGATPLRALRTSWTRTRGRFFELGLPLALWWIFVIVAAFVLTGIIRAATGVLFTQAGFALGVVIPLVLGALALITFLELAWFIAGKMVHVVLVTGLYFESAGSDPAAPPVLPTTRTTPPRGIRLASWIIAAAATSAGITAGAAFVEDLDVRRDLAITGHRGTKVGAPENTLSALRHAIAEGADYAEIDVQTTADGVVVLLHDGDLMRVASVNRRLGAIAYDELRSIDIGSWFSPEFGDERIATLQESMDLVRGRMKLNIELKFNRDDPALVEKVVDLIRSNDFFGECVVSSLSFPALEEVGELSPELTRGFIVFRGVGNFSRVNADFLSLSAAQATTGLVREIHRREREVHVWGVNDLDIALSMIERGVDNIITDYPREVRELLEAWNELSDSQRLALALRSLVTDVEPPEPEPL